MTNDEAILTLALLMAQQSCDPDTYEKFIDFYNRMIEIRKLHLLKIQF